MAINFSCPSCGEEYRVRDDAVGKMLRCKVCGTTSRITDDGDDEDLDDLPPRSRDEDDRPKRKKKKSRAGGATIGPAIGLYVSAAIGLAYGLFSLFTSLAVGPQPPPGADEATRMGYMAGYYMATIIGPLINLLIIASAVCLQTRKAYPFALIGCILASIPCCSPCCILGMPFGIWGIVVLMQDDVKRAFD